LTGCSAHRVSTEGGVSKDAIYKMNESKLFNLVYSSIQEVFPQEKISVLTLPTRGYITKFLAPPFRLDWFTQKVLIHRSSGTDSSGELVYGYWIEVSGGGSSFLQGQLKNSEVFETIISHLEKSAKKQLVSNISKESYLINQENFYVRGSDTLEGQGTRLVITQENNSNNSNQGSNSEQLRELYKLKSDGIITDQKFEEVKRKLLNKFKKNSNKRLHRTNVHCHLLCKNTHKSRHQKFAR
jgi:hypothetical protein